MIYHNPRDEGRLNIKLVFKANRLLTINGSVCLSASYYVMRSNGFHARHKWEVKLNK